MRLKPNHIYFLVIAILVSASYSFAQESASPVLEGMESEKNNSMEFGLSEGEGGTQQVQSVNTPTVTQPSQRETTPPKSTQTKPKTTQPKPSGDAQAKPEESVLGFNFLYYIFQKYKMSDIID